MPTLLSRRGGQSAYTLVRCWRVRASCTPTTAASGTSSWSPPERPSTWSVSTSRRAPDERSIDREDANLNYVRLIAEAKDHAQAGIDAKLRLRARRRAEQLNSELFTEGQG